MSNHPERQDWDDNCIVLHIEGDEYDAYCSPEANGEIFVDDERISAGSGPFDQKMTLSQGDAPFPFDIVFHEPHPTKAGVKALEGEVEEAFIEEFDQRVQEVYEMMQESDDPLGTIMDLEEGTLGVSK